MRGSKLQRKLVAAGRAAAAYGQLEAAAQAWQAAGHWAELLPLLALQGDFAALRSLQHNVSIRSALVLSLLHDGRCGANAWSDPPTFLLCAAILECNTISDKTLHLQVKPS